MISIATIGDVLQEPEKGWQRIDDTNKNITYNGNGWIHDSSYTPYNGTRSANTSAVSDASICFNFTGTRLRLICVTSTNWSNDVKINIDGIEENFSEHGAIVQGQILNYEKTGLENKEHSVIITNAGETYWGVDALDIDESGEILPYNASEEKFLRVTMIDSSDHDYQLSSTEIDAFVKWYNNHVSTDTNAYGLAKKIGNQSSTEYVAFEKIISFEVI